MRKNQTSLTALGIAIIRAVESEKPGDERITYDPYARRFMPGWLYGLCKIFIRCGYTELRGPGVQGFLIGRDRFIDDYLFESIEDKIEQLVILGAGFDARAYRFEEQLKSIKVFEVDHPATQREKKEKIQRILGFIPKNVRFVAVDFTRQSLEETLGREDYDPSLKTLFIWQGVTYYLNGEDVERTLSFISQNSRAGSRLIFDYVYRSVLTGRKTQNEIQGMRRYRFLTGEDLKYGIPEGEECNFLNKFGFTQVEVTNSVDLKDKYFFGKNRQRKIVPGYAILSAVVS